MPDTEPYPPDGTAEPNRAELLVQRPHLFVMVIGGWVVAAPLILDHAAAGVAFAGITDVTVGTALVILAAIRLRHRAAAWLNLVNVALGAVLIATPFVRGFADTAQRATLNDVLAGLMVIMLAGVSWLVDRPAGNRVPVRGAAALPESAYAPRTPVTSGFRTNPVSPGQPSHRTHAAPPGRSAAPPGS
ncbi:SPW repeat protein [Actinoplanes missouriensis]|uniref:SPW repeat domain-containing protein n=1 Tax=Actinoplanes missouriensis TaxID=1866 RepID=UPI0033C389FC